MITYTAKMVALGLAWAGILWWGPAPDVRDPSNPNTEYSIEGLPTEYVVHPLAPTGTPDAPKTPTPTSLTPTPRTCSEWAAYGQRFGWPDTELATLTVIMGRESGCQPQAVGDSGASIGLLQIHCPTWVQPSSNWPTGWAAHHGFNVTCDDLKHPDTNLALGFLIWAGVEGSGGGWWNWTTYTP
jgi:hypothetical protein